MNVIGVTIGVGDHFAQMAWHAAERFTATTGHASYLLHDGSAAGLTHPHHLKFGLFDLFPTADVIVYFDADIVFLEPFDPLALLGPDGFSAVRDLHTQPWIIGDAKRAGVRPEQYFNSGFFVISRQRADLLQLAERLTTTIDTPFKDQTHLNAAARLLGVDVNYLPGRFNTHVDPKHRSPMRDVTTAHVHWLRDVPTADLDQYYKPGRWLIATA